MQGVAIREAKNLGLFVIAVDGNPNAVCVSEADVFEHIDLKNTDELVSFAKKIQKERGLSAVFTTATDFSYAVAKIAEACGLKSHSVAACEKSTNKYLMRKCFEDKGINSVKFFKVTKDTLNDIEKSLNDSKLNFPLVVKPVDNMGARACKKVLTLEELIFAIKKALPYSKSDSVIVEEFIAGKEYSIEGFIIDKHFYVTAIADRHICFSPYFVEMGHSIPSNSNEMDCENVSNVFEQASKALGLSYGVCKGDIFLSEGKAYVGEIAARLSGGYMSGWTVPYSSGINVTKLAILLALGESETVKSELEKLQLPPLREHTKSFCAERAWISIPGTIKKIYGLEEAKKIKGIKNIFPRAGLGDAVVFPTNNVEKCGNVLAIGTTYKKASRRAKKACKKIILRLEKNNPYSELYLKAKFVKSFSELKSVKEHLPYDMEENFNAYKALPDFIDVKPKTLKRLLSKIDDKTCELSFVKNILSKKNSSKPQVIKIIIPKAFKSQLKKLYDLQGRSLLNVLKKAFLLEPKLFDFLQKNRNTKIWKKFWSYLLRGGVQGALYVYDCEK